MTQHEIKELFEAGLINKPTRTQMLILLGFFHAQNAELIKRKIEALERKEAFILPEKGANS